MDRQKERWMGEEKEGKLKGWMEGKDSQLARYYSQLLKTRYEMRLNEKLSPYANPKTVLKTNQEKIHKVPCSQFLK